jgi:hypothetical protein
MARRKGAGTEGLFITISLSHGLLVMIAVTVLFFNILYSQERGLHNAHESNLMSPNSIPYPQTRGQDKSTMITTETRRQLDMTKPRKARVLMGIFTADVFGEPRYREAFRDLFAIHPKVCRLGDYMNTTHSHRRCELIYTFVMAGNVNPDGPTEIVNATTPVLPIITPKEERHPHHSVDFHESDMTFLNIQ